MRGEQQLGMTSVVQCGSLSGIDAVGVRVEVSVVRGLPGIDIVGLPEAAVRESRVRVQAALSNSGFKLPEQKFVVNLAPGDVRKHGSGFDLPIAIALLAQCGLCSPLRLESTLILGELSLDGQLRPARGLLAQLSSAHQRGLTEALIPLAGSGFAKLVSELDVRCAEHLTEAVAFLGGGHELPGPLALDRAPLRHTPCLSDVRGQQAAKRALEIAAAGAHDILMIGPPGTGKSMLAQRLPGLLPEPGREEQLELATIASSAGIAPRPGAASFCERPFRAPHHTCSEVALIGGGDPIRPGEITLAHRGVLFLDELPEFRRSALESLRPTMESGQAVVVRARDRVVMPARPLIVSAMNPCPCGYSGHKRRVCRCSLEQVQRYRGRVSGPLLDRFDLHVALPAVTVHELETLPIGEPSEVVRARVTLARRRKEHRASRRAALGQPTLEELAAELEPKALKLLHRTLAQLEMSLRAYGKVLKVSRTIADLAGSDAVCVAHVAEAVQYRLLDREPFEREPFEREPAWRDGTVGASDARDADAEPTHAPTTAVG